MELTMKGTIDRRLLINFAVDPDVLEEVLPRPFSPKVVGDRAVAGICLIRLAHMRPGFLPPTAGVTSENAAHRIAVVWEDETGSQEGVFIPRRDTSSRLNVMVGGRLFPGVHHHASFDVRESDPHYRVAFRSDDGTAEVMVSGRTANALPSDSLFSSLEEISAFFEAGSAGYSATSDPQRHDGLRLKAYSWQVTPFAVDEVRSSFFDDPSLFPRGTATFDSALMMRGIEHEWKALPSLGPSVVDAAA